MSDSPRTRLRVRPRHVLRWIAVIVVVLLVATVGYAIYNYHHFVSGVTHIDAIPSSSTVTSSGENILLVGDDHRPANASAAELAELGTTADGGGTNTDTMLVLHIPAGGGKASLISFPRDSWVDIPGYGEGKLNAAFVYGSQKGGDAGGAQLLVKTIENVSGLHIDHFVRISMLGFYDVAKALGPIQVCLNSAVDDSFSTFTAPAGVSTLTAKQALAFVRQRHGLPNGDFDRQARQRYFLSREAKNFLSASTILNPGKLNSSLTAASSAIQTDPDLNWLTLAAQLKGLAGGDLESTTIPTSGTPTIYANGTAVSIVQVDTAKMPAFIAALDETKASPSATTGTTAAPAVTPADVTVSVLNGSGVDGAAAASSTALAEAGFGSGTVSSVSNRSATTIQYPASMASEARLVSRYVPGATLEAVTGVAQVTVVLGTDGATAKSSATSGSSGSSGSSSSGSSGSGSSGSGSSAAQNSGSDGSAASTAAAIPCIN